ncbi:MAG: chemotaxis protein CheA, partial [Pseudomonadota bacterium]
RDTVATDADPEAPQLWHMEFQPGPSTLQSGCDPLSVLTALKELGELKVEALGYEDLRLGAFDAEQPQISWRMELRTVEPQERIDEAFAWCTEDCSWVITPPAGASEAAEQPSPAAEAPSATAPEPAEAPPKAASKAAPKAAPKAAGKPNASGGEGSIRVNIDKVDALINLVGELVITQSMLSRFNGEFDFTQLESLREGLTQLTRNTRELQESVMAIRMLPIKVAFSRFPRLVRDTGKALGKQVDLQLSGEGTELDKTVLEKIGDPLVHLVRNSLDHGLETPEKRVAAGKPATGVLELNAFHEGGNIVIEVKDDGAGINTERVLAKARENGLVGADEQLSDDKIHNLIFLAGFSTAEEVSDLSGRGVGMDVVRRNIHDLNGQVSVKSEAGKGSTFTITLPLTLAILDGQLVQVANQSFIIPLVSIVETVQTSEKTMNQVAGGGELFRLRDEYLPVLRLHELFGVPSDQDAPAPSLLVIAEANGQRVGILVNDLLEQQQVVIKSLEANFRQTQGISGATILGDGSVALIVDVAGLTALFTNRPGNSALTAA